MEELHKRFEQTGGLYNYNFEKKDNAIQNGGKIEKDLSPRSENWKQKYLAIKRELDDLENWKQKYLTIKRELDDLKKENKKF